MRTGDNSIILSSLNQIAILIICLILVAKTGNIDAEGLKVEIDDEFTMVVEKFKVVNFRTYDLSGMGVSLEEGMEVTYSIYLFRTMSGRDLIFVDMNTNEEISQSSVKTFDLEWVLSINNFPDPVLIIYTDWTELKASVSRNLESLTNAMNAPMPDHSAKESGDYFNIKYTIDRTESTSYDEFTYTEEYSYYKSSGIIRYYEFHMKIDDDGEISKVDFVFRNSKYSGESINLTFFRDNGLVITLVLIIIGLVAFTIKREFFYYEDYDEDELDDVVE